MVRKKALYVIQQHKTLVDPPAPAKGKQAEVTFDEKDKTNTLGVFIDRGDLGEFEDTAKAMTHMRKHPESGEFRIVAIKKQFSVKVETIIKAQFTGAEENGDDDADESANEASE